MQERMGNVSREIEALRKNQEEVLEIKNILTEMKNAFCGLIRRLDTAKARNSETEDMSVETSQTEMQRERRMRKRWNRMTNNYEPLQKC